MRADAAFKNIVSFFPDEAKQVKSIESCPIHISKIDTAEQDVRGGYRTGIVNRQLRIMLPAIKPLDISKTMENDSMCHPIISVIVPVYNVENYLDRCLDSLLIQTFPDIELILVDDGSEDSSGLICDRYAEKDSRIRVIHHSKNMGLSAARNTGLRLVRGEWIMFVDSDDWVEPDFCKIPYELAQSIGTDLVLFEYESCGRRRRFRKADKARATSNGLKSQREALRYVVIRSAAVWNKLFHRSLFNDISFPEGKFCEDRAVIHRLVRAAEKRYYTNQVLYHYCIREGSITNQGNPQVAEDALTFRKEQIYDLQKWGYPDIAEEAKAGAFFRYLLMNGFDAKRSGECTEFLATIRDVPKSFTWKRKIMWRVLRLSPKLFEWICIASGKRRVA